MCIRDRYAYMGAVGALSARMRDAGCQNIDIWVPLGIAKSSLSLRESDVSASLANSGTLPKNHRFWEPMPRMPGVGKRGFRTFWASRAKKD